jgi:nucleotide-binding universal stress UspA family protein
MALSTILVGCDLSPGADQATDRAVAIAEHHRAKLVLVHAQEEDTPPTEIDREALQQLGEVSAAVRAHDAVGLADRISQIEARGVPVDLISRIGPPGEVIAQAAVERGADVIVIGSHGHTGIARMLLGSVAAATIRHAACDVLVCRGPAAQSLFRRPLVATDFSAVSAKVLAHAALFSEAGATFDVVHAWQLPTGSLGATLLGQARFPWSTVRDAVLASARSLADRLVAEHREFGHPLRVELVQGPPASVVTHAAERAGSDLIAVGAHGRRGVRRLLLGSVAESTIRHSPCSVLVVHGDPKT